MILNWAFSFLAEDPDEHNFINNFKLAFSFQHKIPMNNPCSIKKDSIVLGPSINLSQVPPQSVSRASIIDAALKLVPLTARTTKSLRRPPAHCQSNNFMSKPDLRPFFVRSALTFTTLTGSSMLVVHLQQESVPGQC